MGLFVKFIFFIVLLGLAILLLTGHHLTGYFKEASKLSDKINNEEKKLIDLYEGKSITNQPAPVVKTATQTVAKPNMPQKNTHYCPAHPFGGNSNGFGNIGKHPFGNIDFHHMDGCTQNALNSQVSQDSTSGVNTVNTTPQSQAEQMNSSSNPIIKTWAGYVSNIENLEK